MKTKHGVNEFTGEYFVIHEDGTITGNLDGRGWYQEFLPSNVAFVEAE